MGKHARAKQAIAILQFHAHRGCPRYSIDGRIDVADLGLERAIREGLDTNTGHLANVHPGEVLFVNIGNNPDFRQVGNPVNRHAGCKTHAFNGFFLQHDAVDRRTEA